MKRTEGRFKELTILDGATGTEIAARGVNLQAKRTWSADANIEFPNLVKDIHRDYIQAGAKVITTNTFSTSRNTLSLDGLAEQTEEINRLSAKLAMDARKDCDAEETVLVAGSIAAFEPFKGYSDTMPSYENALEDYREQANILAEAGVDLIILEMFFRTVDLRAAVAAAAETNLPIWVGLSCERHDGEIVLGLTEFMDRHGEETIRDGVVASASPSVEAICIMHSPPHVTADALRELKTHTSLPIGAYAHGGRFDTEKGMAREKPQVGWTSGTDAETYLEYVREWIACGATIIGGCCGTTPEHIRLISNSYRDCTV